MERREWLWSGNWAEGVPPANPTTAAITFGVPGQNVISLLEADRQIGTLNMYATALTIAHTLDLGGKTLTIADVLRPGMAQNFNTTITLTNGTIRMGTEEALASIDARRGTLQMAGDAVCWDVTHLGGITMSDSAYGGAILDLRRAEIVGGIWQAQSLDIAGRQGRILIDPTTRINTFHIRGETKLRPYLDYSYIGNPLETYSLGGVNLGKLPAGINLFFGVNSQNRGLLEIGQLRHGNGVRASIAVAEGGGGAVTAYLAALRVGFSPSSSIVGTAYGMLDLAAMDSCLIDSDIIAIGTERAAPLDTDNINGTVRLPVGEVVAGTVTVGGQGVGAALLACSNTTVTVTNSVAFNKTARVTLSVGAEAGGLVVERKAADALTIAEGARLTLNFTAPGTERPHYALRWLGNHAATLNSWLDDGRMVIDDTGLGRKATVFVSGAATYIGVPPSGGTVLMLR